MNTIKQISKPALIGFYGFSNSGKTRTIKKVIETLTVKGYRIAAIKKSDKKIRADQEGKDTRDFSLAGSKAVVLSASDTTTFFINKKMASDAIVKMLYLSDSFDFILIEGANEKEVKKIRVGNIPLRENTIWTYNDNFEDLISRIIKEKEHV